MTYPDAPAPPVHPSSPYAVTATAPMPGRPVAAEDTGVGGPSGSAPGAGAAPHNRLAVAAFVVGLVSFLLCALPPINALSVVGGLVAVGLGIAGRRRSARRLVGKGFAVWGLVLGGLSFTVSAAIWVFIGFAIATLEDGDLETILREVSVAVGAETAPVVTAPQAAGDEAVPGEVDLASVSCDVVAQEAIAASQAIAGGDPALVDIRDTTVLEDHRADVTTPGVAQESLVLSCLGTGTWSDGTETPVETVLLLDSDNHLIVDFVGL